jgi:hypothetical protein
MLKKLPMLVAFGFALAAAPFEANGEGCNVHQIRGTYATSCQGFISPQAGVFVPLAAVGVQSSDSEGVFNGKGNVSIGGQQVVERFEQGTPVLNDDCSGKITYKITLVTPQGDVPQPDQTFAFVVLDHGDRLRSIDIDPGQTVSCLLERISHAPIR